MKTFTKRAFLTILSFILFAGISLADGENPGKGTGNIVKISGQVVDQNTGETLAGVKLIVEGTNEVIYTDFDGEFQIQCDLSKNPELSVTLISYENKTLKIKGTDKMKIKLNRHK